LLSDNRHYTFYLWRRCLSKYPEVLSMVYVCSAAMVVGRLSHVSERSRTLFPVGNIFLLTELVCRCR
jgi:hypothetical protein